MNPGSARDRAWDGLRLDRYRGPVDDPAPPVGGWVASVAVIRRPASGSDEILLIQRARFDTDPWSGHMALPGGRREPDDRSLLETAIRETREETAIELDAYGVALGSLAVVEPQSVRLPALSILPLVFSVPAGTMAEVVSAEVADAFWVPITSLTDPGARTVHRRRIDDRVLTFPALAVEDRIVWGMTRRILQDLISRMP